MRAFHCLASIYDPLDGVVPRNIYSRPGTYFQEVALGKNIRASESVSVQLRAEFYNLFNHANREFAGGADLNAPIFSANTVAGPIARYGGTPRQVVVAARVVF